MKKLTTERILELIHQKKISQWQTISGSYHPADVTEIICNLPREEMIIALRWLPTVIASQIFTFMNNEKKEEIIDALSNYELKFLNLLYSDEIVDAIEELPANITQKILRLIPDEKRKKVNNLLNYPEDTAGSIMDVNFLSLKKDLTIKTAQIKVNQWIKKYPEDINYFFIVDQNKHFLGIIKWNEIMVNTNLDLPLKKLIVPYSVVVRSNEDQEIVAQKFQKYNLDIIPVVNFQNCLLGVISSQQITEIIAKESTEDLGLLTGSTTFNQNYFEVKIHKVVWTSSIWLVSIMLTASLGQIIVTECLKWFNVYDDDNNTDAGHLVLNLLVPILPLLAGSCGNAGSQSSSRIVRAIALGHIPKNKISKAIRKEFSISVMTGVILVSINLIRMVIIYLMTNQQHHINHTHWKTILVASISLFWAEVVAKTLGASLPFTLQKLKLDPALSSVPVLTTLMDSITTLIFFGMGALILLH